MTGPTFIVAGAQKAGTTSLYAMLAQHPDVFMSDPKEPGYFIRGFDDPERWQTLQRPGPDGVPQSLAEVRQGIFTAQDYAALFASEAARRARHRGEASTPYLPSPHAARRIAETVPDARIVLALRDPVARAYSAWGYNRARGNEGAASFEQAVEHELAGGRDDWIWGWRYLYSGLYGRHVGRYYDHFARDRILIVKFEDFRDDAAATFDRVCDFLEIPRCEVSQGARENATTRHTNPLLARSRAAFTSPGALKSAAGLLLPKRLRNRLRKRALGAIDRFGEAPRPLAAETRERLAGYFAEDTERLRQLTGLDLADWAPIAHGRAHAASDNWRA
jgi:hypothetical protein